MRGLKGTLAAAAALALALSLVAASGAGAVKYPNTPSGSIGPIAVAPVGVAVDESTGNVYVADASNKQEGPPPKGWLLRFDAGGTPLTPPTMGSGYFTGVAVQQGGSHTVYGFDNGFLGLFGTPSISAYDSSGAALGSPFPFTVDASGFAQIASDPAGNIYFPDQTTNTVKKYTSAGAPATPASFECTGAECESKPLSEPNSVAVDSSGRLYVADMGNQRVIRFEADGSNPTVFSTGSSESVVVDTANGLVFVGGLTGTGFGYKVSVYDLAGNPQGSFGDGTISDDPSGAIHSQIAVNSSNGLVYVSQSDFQTPANSKVWIFAPVAEPSATTDPATNISASGAKLNGTVNPAEVETESCTFQYTVEADFIANEWANATAAPCVPNPASASTPTAVSATLSGLSPLSSYEYRVVEKTAGGTASGGPVKFTTASPAPKATTEAASGISQSTATLNGKVDAEGGEAECKFEYGATTAYGKTAPCSITPVTGTDPTAVSAALTGLAAATTYHYRLVAGTVKGADLSFATLADTCATKAALCPPAPPAPTPPVTTPPVTTPPVTKPLTCKKGFKKKKVKGKFKCVKLKKKHHKKKH
jgi:hypothetical protein